MKKSSLSYSVRIALALGSVLALLVAPTDRLSSSASLTGLFVTFNQVADSSMAIPEGTGTFTGFPNAPAIDGGDVSVFATGVYGQQGIYRFGPSPPPIKVADLNTAVPDAPEGVTTFTGFSGAPVISGDSVAFVGTGTDWQGIYRFVPPNPIRVADLSTPIPNGTGSFTGFIPVDPCISASLAVFSGSGSGGQEGVYLVDVALPAPPTIMPIADTNTEIPGGSGNFTRFKPNPPPITPVAPLISGQYLVFFGAFPGPYPTLGFNTYFTPNPVTYRAGATGRGGVFQFQNGDGKLIYYTAPYADADSAFSFTPRFTITQDGNVGIGTTTPTAALHVSGGNAVFTSPGTAVTGQTSGNGAFSIGILGLGLSGGYAGYFQGKLAITNTPGGGIFQMCKDINLVVADCSSSLRYKKELQPFVDGLNFIEQLRPIAFKWKSSDRPDVGFGAEDVEKTNPLFVTYNQKGEVEGVKYDRLSVVFVNAIKEQQKQIKELQSLIEQQQALINRRQHQLEALTRSVCQSKPRTDICRKRKSGS